MDLDEQQSAVLELLGPVVAELVENPSSEPLHYKSLALSQQAGAAPDDLENARDGLTAFFPTTDAVWLPLLETKVRKVASGELSGEEMHATFERAEQDYFSIPVLKAHLDFLTQGAQAAAEKADEDEEDDFFSLENVQELCSAIVSKSTVHTTEGHIVWDAWRDWWQGVVDTSQAEKRSDRLQVLKLEYLKRLAQPHSTNEGTAQAYSSLVTNYLPPSEYEATMMHATKVREPARTAWVNRERWQSQLVRHLSLRFLPNVDHYGIFYRPPPCQSVRQHNAQAYFEHIEAEKSKRQRTKDPRAKDPTPIVNLYERAIAHVASQKVQALLASANPTQTGTVEQELQGAEAWLLAFWQGFITFLQQDDVDLPETEFEVLRRATRSVPSNGLLWVEYIHALESKDLEGEILNILPKALGSGSLDAKAVSDVTIAAIVPAYRSLRDNFDVDIFSYVIETLEDAIRRVRDAGGEPKLKLEQFLVHVYLHPTGEPASDYAEDSITGAMDVWEKAVKHYKKHWHVWTSFIDFLTMTAKNFPRARKAFREFSGAHLAVDYPEAVYEAWISFEEKWGTSEELHAARTKVKKLENALAEKRAKDSRKMAESQPVAEPVSSATSQFLTQGQPVANSVDILMSNGEGSDHIRRQPSTSAAVVSLDSPGRTSSKRKATEVEDQDSKEAKKVKTAPVSTTIDLKRDREKTTVFVAGLPADVVDDDLQNLFKDCGAIREIKVSSVEGSHVATVEFNERASVPPALTKDKKRLRGEELAVHQAWRSTLYVTNFPETYTDKSIRELFGKYGTLFDVRWPSKKFKSTRRFCYVQYLYPSAAEAALVLDQFQLGENRSLSVAISDPERKKDRTDADADQREIHVGGLSNHVGKADLEKLFNNYGTVKEVRLVLDDRGRHKGFAFVEFTSTTDAMGALAANNTDLKGRRLAITMADKRVAAKKPPPQSNLPRNTEVVSRTVRLTGLPKDLSSEHEPLLQQALEQIIGVGKVGLLVVRNENGKKEGTVELQTQADASKLVLQGTMQFQDMTISFSEEAQRSRPSRRAPGISSGSGAKKRLLPSGSANNDSTTLPPTGKAKQKGRVKFADEAMDEDESQVAAELTGEMQETDRPSGNTNATPSEEGTSSTVPFVPRATKRGRGGGNRNLSSSRPASLTMSTRSASKSASSSAPKGQDEFRKMLG
ncbi:hypothetical protein DL93DRAFT_2230235 [Clavulina sp. PMI_390]|nr:hypothetical protein DL93DRAFT_2230235 [Clavulina sp. PMI_390]